MNIRSASLVAFRRAVRGVGLVELMVTLVISALVVAGTIALFNANRQSFRLQDSVAQAQQAGSFALDFIAQDLHRAGYPGDILNPIGGFDTANTVNDRVETMTETIHGVDEDVDFTDDQLAIVYAPDRYSAEVTCTGDAIPGGTTYISNRYWVRTSAAGNERELVCQGFALTTSGNAITGRTAIGTPQALVGGVDSFQVLYGVDTTPTEIPGAGAPCVESASLPNLYITGNLLAGAIAAGAAVPSCAMEMTPVSVVRSVRIALLMRTANVNAQPVPDQSFPVLDRVVDEDNFTPIGDGRIRRLFVTTVSMRNTERVVR